MTTTFSERMAADPERAEWLHRVVAGFPPMTAEQITLARRILCTPTAAEVPRPASEPVSQPSGPGPIARPTADPVSKPSAEPVRRPRRGGEAT